MASTVIGGLALGGPLGTLRPTQDDQIADTAGVPYWRLPVDSPLTVIGGSDEDEDYDLEGGAKAVRLRNGNVVVLDRYPKTPFRVFSPKGRLLKKLRSGEGPPDVPPNGFDLTRAAGDTVLIGSIGTFKVIDPVSLVVARDIRTDKLSAAAPMGVLADGRLVGIDILRDHPRAEGGTLTWDMIWVVWSGTGSRRTMTRFPFNGPYQPDGHNAFMRRTAYRVLGSRIALAFNEKPEIEIRDTTDKIVKRIRVNLPIRTVTAKDLEALADDIIRSRGGVGADSIRSVYKSPHFRKMMNFFEALYADTDGTLWAELFRAKFLSERHDYLIFDPRGRLVAKTSLPGNAWLHDVGRDAVVISTTDEEGHQYIRVVPIRK